MTAIWLKHKLNDGNFIRIFEPKPQTYWEKAERRWDEDMQVKREKRARRARRMARRNKQLLLAGKVSVTERVLTASTAVTGVYLLARVVGATFPNLALVSFVRQFLP